MTDLLILTDISQVAALEAEARDIFRNAKIVTANIAVAACLESRRIPFIDEWDFLRPDDVQRNWEVAWTLSHRWWEEGMIGSEPLAFPLAEIAGTEFYWPFEWCLNARLIYDRLLDSLPVQTIYGYFLPPKGVCQSGPKPWNRAIASLSHAVLYWCAANKGIPVRRLGITRPLSVETGTPNPEPRVALQDAPLAKREPPLRVNLCSSLPGHPVWHGEDRLRATAGANLRTVFTMEFLAGQETAALESMFSQTPGWQLVNVGHMASEAGIVAWPWHENEFLQPLRAAKRAFDAGRAVYAGEFPELFGNPFLRFQFDRIWDEIFKAVRLGESFRSLLQSERPSLVLFGYDGFAIECMLKRIARSEGVPTAALIHGGLNHATGARPCINDADHLLVWGEEDARNAARYGFEREKARIVGSIRFGDLYDSNLRKERQSGSPTQHTARRALGIPEGNPTIVLLTATIFGMSAPISEPAKHRETWRQIAEMAARRPDLTFAIKPHPGWDHFEFYRVICEHGRANLVYLWDANLKNVLAAGDVAVLVNLCTTAALEAMLQGLPVVYLHGAVYPIEACIDSFQAGGAICVDDVAQLEPILNRLLQDDDFRKATLAAAEPFLASCLGAGDGTAPERMFRECQEIALQAPAAPSRQCFETLCHHQLAAAIKVLPPNGGEEKFLDVWKSTIEALASAPLSPSFIEGILFSLSYEIGRSSEFPQRLQMLIEHCFRAARRKLSLATGAKRKMLANALVAGIVGHLRNECWSSAVVFFQYAMQQAPRAITRLSRSPQLMQSLSRALEEHQRVRVAEAQRVMERAFESREKAVPNSSVQRLRGRLAALARRYRLTRLFGRSLKKIVRGLASSR